MVLFGLLLLCLALALICNLWMLIRIARSSALTAVLAFLFAPVAIFHLIKHWGEDEHDIRAPFFAMIAFSLLAVYAAQRTMNWATKSLEAERALTQSMLSQLKDDGRDGLDRSIAIARAQAGVSFVGGKVALPEAHAVLEVPEHFRFGRAEVVKPLADAMGRGLTPGTVGWLIHDKVSVTDPHPWVVEVHWFALGHVAEGESSSLAPAALVSGRNAVLGQDNIAAPGGAFEWKGFVYQPQWDALHGWLAWSESTHYADPDVDLVDCYADMPGREGVLRYGVEFLTEARGEVGFRAVRLMASHTQFEPGWTAADYSRVWHRNSGFQLADLVSGRAYGL